MKSWTPGKGNWRAWTRWAISACALLAAGGLAPATYAASPAVTIPGGDFVPLFGADPGLSTVHVAPFRMDVDPVTNAEFFAFTLAHTEWSPERIAPQFADAQYLTHWTADAGGRRAPTPEQMDRPATLVSWFAADAYCHGQGGLLPTTFQWEFAAAADPTRADARQDLSFAAQILAWYSQPFQLANLRAVGQDTPNFYGVRDLHQLVWEWVDDFDSPRFSGAGGRGEGNPAFATCGAAAYGAQGMRDYAAFMRFALRSSLQSQYTSASLGFRCAYAAR